MSQQERSDLPRAVHPLEGVESYVERRKRSGAYETTVDTSSAMSPFGPPAEYGLILDDLYRSGLLYESGIIYPELNLNPALAFIRERHAVPDEFDIEIGFSGSNEILERVAMTFKRDSLVFGIGPHFTGFHKAIKTIGKSKYGPISPPLSEPLDTILERTVPSKYPKKPDVLYLAVPDARGDDANPDALNTFLEMWCEKDVFVVLDKALADFSPDSSYFHPNLIEVRSFSKAIGLPGDGFSYLIGEGGYISEFRKYMKDYSHRGKSIFMAELLNRLSRPEVIYPHLEMVRRKTRDVKTKMMAIFDNFGIDYLPTSPNTPLLFVDSHLEGFYNWLDLPSTPGSGFFYTYDTNASSTPLTNRYVRIGIPQIDYSDPNLDIEAEIELIAKRIKGAINIGKSM